MSNTKQLQEIVYNNVKNSLRYIEDGFNLYKSKSKNNLITVLESSPTDMGEERSLEDIKNFAEKEGWKFSNWNAKLWLLKYVFFNIYIISTDEISDELSLAGFDKNILNNKKNSLKFDPDEMWRDHTQFIWRDMCIRSSLFQKILEKMIRLDPSKYSIKIIDDYLEELEKNLTIIKSPDAKGIKKDYKSRLNFLVKNKKKIDLIFNALLQIELSVVKTTLERFKSDYEALQK